MTRVTQRSVAHHGIAVPATRVSTECGQALISEGAKVKRSMAWMVTDVLEDWYQAVYLPAQKAKEGK